MLQSYKTFSTVDASADYSEAQSATTVYAPPSGKKVFLTGYFISSEGANTVQVLLGATVVLKFYFGANGGANCVNFESPIAVGAADAILKVTSSGSVNHFVGFTGYVA